MLKSPAVDELLSNLTHSEDDYCAHELQTLQLPSTSSRPTNMLQDATNIDAWNASLGAANSKVSISKMKENMAVSLNYWIQNSNS